MQPDEYMKLPGWRQPKDADIAEAKRLLGEAGYPNGFKAQMLFRRGISHPTTQSEPVASQLKAIGLDIEVRVMDTGLFADQVYNKKDFDMINDGGTSGDTMATTAYQKWHSKGGTNYTSIKDPELDRLAEAALTETDRNKKNQLFIQMQKIIVDNVYYAPIVTLAQFFALQPWMHETFLSHSVTPDLLDPSRVWMEVDKMPASRRSF
jgi:peptide/nickel transport system substrate-binding protein